MKYYIRKGLYLLMAILCVGWVQAQTTKTIYVSPSGDDGNDGNSTTSAKTLVGAVNSATGGETINLAAGEYTLSSQLVINKAITLKGENMATTIIKAVGNSWSNTNSQRNLVSIESGETGKTVTLKNLTISNSKRNGINAQTAMTTELENVTLSNNYAAGMVVHSVVKAKGLHTSGNGWGGVNVDLGSPKYNTISFKFDEHSVFTENTKIWAEKRVGSPDVVQTPSTSSNWVRTDTGDMYSWSNSALSWEIVMDKTCKNYYVYANGNPVTVEADGEAMTKIKVSETDYLRYNNADTVYLFGGSKDANVSSTNITMNSGTLRRIYGGGYGSSASATANVSETAKIEVKGGTVSGLIVGGGHKFVTVNTVDIVITGLDTKVQCLYAGGFSDGAQSTLQTEWEKVVCGAKTVNIDITDATLVEGLGCGGGQGYAYTGASNVNIRGAKLGSLYGTLSNGYATHIKATLTGCTFDNLASWFEIGTINRGMVRSATFTFEESSFPSSADITTFTIGAIEGWGDSDTNGNPAPKVTSDVCYNFNNCTNVPVVQIGEGVEDAHVTVNGAPVVLRKFRRGTKVTAANGGTEKTEFELKTGKTWTFNKGLAINNDVRFTKSGTLTVLVSNPTELVTAVNAGADKVTMLEGNYPLSEQLTINHPMTLEGTFTAVDSTRLVRTTDWTGTTNSNKHMICVQANNVELKNLIVDAKGTSSGASVEGSGIQAYNATGVKLTNVVARNTKAAGVIVNSSIVTAENLHTEGNAWGGVNTDQKTTGIPSFTFTNSTFDERPLQVWAEEVNGISVVKAPDGWRTLHENGFYVWTSDNMTKEVVGDVTYVYANGYEVKVSAAEEEGKTDITSGSQTLTFANTDKVYLFGGSKDASVKNTNITMNSGQISRIFGGGHGTSDGSSANVAQIAKVTITGGEVERVIGGGYKYAKNDSVEISISNSKTLIYRLYPGGYAEGISAFPTSYETAATATKGVKISIDGATIKNAFGCGGGFGYTYTGYSNVDIKNATLGDFLGTYSNGYADQIKARVYYTDFKPFKWKGYEDVYYDLCTINRGKVNQAAFTFDYCRFNSTSDEVTTEHPITATIGAASGWADSDTNGSDVPVVLGSVSYNFINCTNPPTIQIGEGLENANVTVTGTLAKIDKYNRGKAFDENNKYLTAFSIANNKTWTFYGGLEMTPEITLTNNGNLAVENGCTVATSQQLKTVLAQNKSIVFIDLAKQTFAEDFTVSKAQVIRGNKKATITGTVTMQAGRLEEVKLLPTTGKKAVIVEKSAEIHHNYWGADPNFAELITTDPSDATPYPYYSDAEMTEESLVKNIKTVTGKEELSGLFDGGILDIQAGGHAILKQDGVVFESVNIEEGGQLTPDYGENMVRAAKAKNFVFKPALEAKKWKALGTPFKSTLIDKIGNKADLAAANADAGVWFATLKDDHTPEIVVSMEAVENNAGLWAATGEQSYAFKAEEVYLENTVNPVFSLDNGANLQMCVNPNTYAITTDKTIYVLDVTNNVFVRTKDGETTTIAPFQSFVIADANTTATLRSIGTTDPNATGNEFVVKEGYYLTTERGAIVVHTAEPMELYVVAVSGAVVYRGTVADGERIAVPTGFYAVNGQMVRVK